MGKITKILLIIFGGTMAVFAFTMLILVIYRILFANSVNQATILSGVLSFLGGVAGAAAAYFIARMQMTEQIDLQFNKEKHKMNLEIEIENLQSALHLLAKIRNTIMKIDGFRIDFVNQYLDTIVIMNLEIIQEDNDRKAINNFNQTFDNGKKLINEFAENCSQYIVYEFVYKEQSRFELFYSGLIEKMNLFNLWYQAPITEEKIGLIKNSDEMFKSLSNDILVEIIYMQDRLKSRMNDYKGN